MVTGETTKYIWCKRKNVLKLNCNKRRARVERTSYDTIHRYNIHICVEPTNTSEINPSAFSSSFFLPLPPSLPAVCTIAVNSRRVRRSAHTLTRSVLSKRTGTQTQNVYETKQCDVRCRLEIDGLRIIFLLLFSDDISVALLSLLYSLSLVAAVAAQCFDEMQMY